MGLLKKNGNITISESGLIYLTDQGKEVANKILERHRVLSSLLIRLGVDPETAAEDACRIEHVISDNTFEHLKAFIQKESE
jgi:Mn-dependent DtxR family transcriptional regulator